MNHHRYRVSLRRESESLALETTDISVLMVESKPPSAASTAKYRTRVQALHPPVRLDDAGNFIRFVNPEAFDPSNETREMIGKVFGGVADVEEVRATAKLRVVEYWFVRVLNWTDTHYELGKPLVEANLDPMFGDDIEGELETTVTRPLPGKVKLVGRKQFDEEALANSIRAVVFGLIDALAQVTAKGKAALESREFLGHETRATVTMSEAAMQASVFRQTSPWKFS